MKEKKESKKDFEWLKEFFKTPRGKGILFLLVYFVFFIFLISALGSGEGASSEEIKKSAYDLSLLEQGNYHFKYIDFFGNNSVTYEGDTNGLKSLFNRSINQNIESYFSSDSIYMKRDVLTNQYVLVDNPYYFSELKSVTNIKNILDSATYISKTEFTNDDLGYTYQISTTTLVKILEDKDIDLDDYPNTINLVMNSSRQIYKIEYQFDSYSSYKGLGSYKASLEYSNFGNVKEIEKPV